ncbi:MAG: hypothetical protein IT160_14455 [Bryobacterales bacterium]|nr:hypothetical protein [Bryobacterales bacterium]
MELVLVGISLPLSLGVAFLIQKMALAALLHCLAPAINPRVFAATRRRG